MISYTVCHLKLLPTFKSFTTKSRTTVKNHKKNLSVFPAPRPNSCDFFNVVANILLKVSLICFWDAAHHDNDDKIKVLNVLI